MADIIVGQFEGLILGSGIKEDVQIFWDGADFLYAKTISGGNTQITYDSFINYIDGQIISQYLTPEDNYIFTFFRYYPFAIINTDAPQEPSEEINIDNIAVEDQSIFGVADGEATITASGVPEIEYSINGVDFFDSGVFENLAPGLYVATARSKVTLIYTTRQFTIAQAIEPPTPPLPEPTKDFIAQSGAELEIQNAYKRVKVKTVFGKAPSVLANGDFEVYDGQNWEFWVKYGGINVSRYQRTIKNTLGVEIPIENYAIKFNERAVDSKYIQHTDIAVNAGDTIKASYRVGRTEGTGETTGFYTISGIPFAARFKTFYSCKIRVRSGDKYLANPDYGNNYVWVNQVATVNHMIDNPQGDLSNFVVNFTIPEIPNTGVLVIQIYGFQKVQQAILNNSGNVYEKDLPEYVPIVFDDLSFSKSSQNDNNDIDGLLSISDNLRYYSEVPDTFEILFGDLFYRADKLQPLDNLYAIKYNNEFTNGWYEFSGSSSAPVPFGMALAKSILTAYQKPFRNWNGSLVLEQESKEMGYLDVMQFKVPSSTAFSRKVFAISGCEIDLKSNTIDNVVLTEIFNRPARSNDVTVPSYPDMPDPVFTQDPNGVENSGIFTEEFTEEFN